MDEPSSALDPLAEYRLNQELNEIAKDKTVIFISHRLSTAAGRGLYLYDGERAGLVESGTHEQLLSKVENMRLCGRCRQGCTRMCPGMRERCQEKIL